MCRCGFGGACVLGAGNTGVAALGGRGGICGVRTAAMGCMAGRSVSNCELELYLASNNFANVTALGKESGCQGKTSRCISALRPLIKKSNNAAGESPSTRLAKVLKVV